MTDPPQKKRVPKKVMLDPAASAPGQLSNMNLTVNDPSPSPHQSQSNVTHQDGAVNLTSGRICTPQFSEDEQQHDGMINDGGNSEKRTTETTPVDGFVSIGSEELLHPESRALKLNLVIYPENTSEAQKLEANQDFTESNNASATFPQTDASTFAPPSPHVAQNSEAKDALIDLTSAASTKTNFKISIPENTDAIDASTFAPPSPHVAQNSEAKDALIDLTSAASTETNSKISKPDTVCGFVVSDVDLSLATVLPELYSTGYRLVHDPKSNMTLSIGSEYLKMTADGQILQDRWVFIQALEVVPDGLIDDETSQLNFMFLEGLKVQQFLESNSAA